ncbi:MAG: hypothetical protein M1817_005005 [Caeruleum heppii]|nr:MAG: hypothetical protein M1817_005005 [Caeruleum heppii]
MSSFFTKFRVNSSAGNPSASTSPAKKDPSAPPSTPLQKLLEGAGPIREDGSDKFFGMENFGNTCYCNSILQCLYYTVPFRDQILQYPVHSPLNTVNHAPNGLPRLNTTTTSPNSSNIPSSPPTRQPGTSPGSPLPRRSLAVTGSPVQGGIRPEDKPDSPEYKKKHAMLAGPILSMDYENAKSYGMSESLFTSLKDIFEAMVAHPSRIGVVSPLKFLEVLKKENEMFRTSMHQDAHEFLNLLLNEVMSSIETIVKEANDGRGAVSRTGLTTSLASVMASVASSTAPPNPMNARWVHDLFEGTLTSETRCLTCENTSQRDEAFLDLSVDLEQHSSVTACLRKFSEEEMLCERNKFHCDNCGGLQEAEKRMVIKRLPRVLALHLKRFKYTEDLQRLQKLFHRVVYPYHLRLFNTTDDAEDPDRLYELYAVVVHIGGGPYHGHYVSIIKTEDRGWLLFDDEMVEPVDKSFVRNFFGDKPGLACAYVLFYQETTFEKVRREQEAEGAPIVQVPLPMKDGVPVKGSPALANGSLQHVQSHPVPPAEEPEHLADLEHSATAPPKTPLGISFESEEVSLPARLPVAHPQSHEIKSKKERVEEEKRNKQAEKERTKAEQQRLRDLEQRRKDYDKRQRDDIKAAIAASKQSMRADEETRIASEAADKVKENGVPTGGIMSGSLNRFRQSSKSMSMGRKPKFWANKEKEDPPRKSHEKLHDASNLPDGGRQAQDADPAVLGQSPDKGKSNRFSLRKKSSHLFNM